MFKTVLLNCAHKHLHAPPSTYTKFDYISGLIVTTLWPIALSFVLLFVAPLGSLIKGRSYWKVELLTNIETPIP